MQASRTGVFFRPVVLLVAAIAAATATRADSVAPAVAITSPIPGALVSGSVNVTASASDTDGIAGVQFTLDGENLGVEDTTAPYVVTWNTSTAADGFHTLTATARDTAGNTATSTAVTVSVRILPACYGSTGWDPEWGSYFVDASRNCDDDLTRAGVNGPDGVDAMDFDGDCDQDIVTGWEENGRVFVYLNPRLRQRPVGARTPCPKTYPAAAGDDLLIFRQWPYSEITRDDTDDSAPFRAVEDAIFVDNNGDKVADYIVISTEIGSDSDGRREIFVSVPSDGSSVNLDPPVWQWTTFKLTGEENYMRATVGDVNGDGHLDIVAGSKSANGASGDIRWWKGPAGGWTPEVWKNGPKSNVPERSALRNLWGSHRLIAKQIHWIMEIVVVDLETTERPDGLDYPELLFTDRDTVGYFRVSNEELIDDPDGWQLVSIDRPGGSPFRWLDIGQLVRNGPDGSDGPPEIVAAYNDAAYSADSDNGVFARWYEQTGGVWHRYDVVLDGGMLPWTYHKDNANKSTALADLDGDGRNEIVASIRGLDYSAVFYLAPRPGRTAEDQRCNGSNCGVDEQWVIHRISPHFSGGEVKADNLALVDIDLDCDIDVVSVDENFGANQRGLGVSWYANTVPQRGFPCNASPAFVAPDLSTAVVDEGTPYARDFVVRDDDDPAPALTVTLAPGSPGEIVRKDLRGGVWTWRDTPVDGLSPRHAPRLNVELIVSDGWANGTASAAFAYYQVNVAPTIAAMEVDPASIVVGQPMTVSVWSTDPAFQADTYGCHLDYGDGSESDGSAPRGFCSRSHTYAAPGTYLIVATVYDEDSGQSALSATVEVSNPAPVVDVPTLAGPLWEGRPLTAAAAFTDEAPSGPYTCTADFGDGTSVAGVLTGGSCAAGPHAYADDGTYEVIVEITDKYGVTGRATTTVAIANVVPLVTAAGASIAENGTATITGTISDPGRLDAFTIVVSWGNGRTTTASYNAGVSAWSASMQYLDDDPTGTSLDAYPVSVTVLDDGAVPGLATTTVMVSNVAPSVAIDSATDEFGNQAGGAAVVLEHTSVTLAASVADAGTLDTHVATVDWGDESTQPMPIVTSTASASHTFAAPGTYQVNVTVSDDDAGSTTAGVRIEVVEASGALAHLVGLLGARLGDPATSPETAAAIRRALIELSGPPDGSSASGALDLIARRAWTAALLKLRNAVVELGAAGLESESALLVLVARSLVIDLIESAVRHPEASAEAEAILRGIDPTSPYPDQIDACERALVVLRPALR